MAAVDAKAINIYMSVTGPYSAQIARKGAETQAFGNQANAGFAKAQSGAARFGATASKIALGGAVAIAAGLALSAKAAITFESSFAGVRKTVDTTEAGFQRLSDGIRKMATEIPVGVNELNRIAELGGQLGVGAEDLLEFTEVIAKIGVTTTLSTEEAATGFARLDNIMQLGKDRFDEMGSTIVELGNNFAATEDEILNFALRVAPIGATVGLATDEVLAIATAFTSVGVRAERGGTAIQKTFIEIAEAAQTGGEELAIFARVAGMTEEQFKDLVDADPAQAFSSFITGLGEVNEAGGNVFATLDSLHLGNSRVVQSLLAMANAEGVLVDALDSADAAWESNLALTEEAEKRFETTASQLLILKGTIVDMGISIGTELLPFVGDFIGGLKQIFDWVVGLTPEMKLLVAVVGGVSLALVALGTGHPAFLAVAAIAGAIGWLGRRAQKAQERVEALSEAISGINNFETTELDLDTIFGKEVVDFWNNLGFTDAEISKAVSGTEAQYRKFADRMNAIIKDKGSGVGGLIGFVGDDDIYDVLLIENERRAIEGLILTQKELNAVRLQGEFVYQESRDPDVKRREIENEIRERFNKRRGQIVVGGAEVVIPAILSAEQIDDTRDALDDFKDVFSEGFDEINDELRGQIDLFYEFGDDFEFAWQDILDTTRRQMGAIAAFEQFFADHDIAPEAERLLRSAFASPAQMEAFVKSYEVDPATALASIRVLGTLMGKEMSEIVELAYNTRKPGLELLAAKDILVELAGVTAEVVESGEYDVIGAWLSVMEIAQAELSPSKFSAVLDMLLGAVTDPAIAASLGIDIGLIDDFIAALNRIPTNTNATITLAFRKIGEDEYLGFDKTPPPIPDKRSAFGGNIPSQQPTLVGELGPEVFVPFSAGSIIPNSKLGGGGDTEYNLNVYGSTDAGNDGAAILLTAQMIGKL